MDVERDSVAGSKTGGRRGADRSSTGKAAFEAAGILREQIVRRELPVGEALPVESELTTQLGASQSVIREALRILETEGLIEVRRGVGGGPRVTHPSIVSVAQALGIHLQLQAVSVTDVWSAHSELVVSAIGQLARQPTEDAIAAVDTALERLEAQIGARWEYSIAFTDVAEELVRQCGNATQLIIVSALHEVIASTLATADAELGYANTEVQTRLHQSLQEVVKRIRAGRPEAACRTYEREAVQLADGMQRLLPGATIVDVFPWRLP